MVTWRLLMNKLVAGSYNDLNALMLSKHFSRVLYFFLGKLAKYNLNNHILQYLNIICIWVFILITTTETKRYYSKFKEHQGQCLKILDSHITLCYVTIAIWREWNIACLKIPEVNALNRTNTINCTSFCTYWPWNLYWSWTCDFWT